MRRKRKIAETDDGKVSVTVTYESDSDDNDNQSDNDEPCTLLITSLLRDDSTNFRQHQRVEVVRTVGVLDIRGINRGGGYHLMDREFDLYFEATVSARHEGAVAGHGPALPTFDVLVYRI